MKEVLIDCSRMDSPRALHEALAENLRFPGWYGHNLDALHDQLTSLSEDLHLTLLSFGALGRAGIGFRRVLDDAELENDHLFVTIA